MEGAEVVVPRNAHGQSREQREGDGLFGEERDGGINSASLLPRSAT